MRAQPCHWIGTCCSKFLDQSVLRVNRCQSDTQGPFRFSSKERLRHDWTSSAQISLESAMRKPRKVVPITRGERKNARVRSELTAPVKEEIRILTCRLSPASMTFHLGPPLLLRHAASKPHAPAGKLLPFRARTPDSGQNK